MKDYAQIHALERRYNLGFRSFEDWSHMWMNNPVWRRTPGLATGWVLEDNEGQIVGSIGSVPFGAELNGRSLIVATSSAWVVDDQYRAYAPLLLDRFFSQPGIDLCLCISPNAEAQPALTQHVQRVPVGQWDRAAFWITNAWDFVGSALKRRNVSAAGLVRYPAWLATVIHRAVKRDELRAALRKAGRHAVVNCTTFDERFDEFWNTVRSTRPGQLLFTRTREVLDWHFSHLVARGTAWVSTVSEGDRLLAYAVFCRKDVTTIGLRRLRLVDYQSIDGGTSLLAPILADAIERCRHDGTAVLESIGWRLENGDAMDRLAPYFRTLPSWQYYYKVVDPALAPALADRAVWNPSRYDGDACL